jgi:hypothetical protein
MIVVDGAEVRRHHKEKYTQMKKIMSIMLGMSLVIGAASLAFAQTGTKKTSTKKSSTKKPSTKKPSTKT